MSEVFLCRNTQNRGFKSDVLDKERYNIFALYFAVNLIAASDPFAPSVQLYNANNP